MIGHLYNAQNHKSGQFGTVICQCYEFRSSALSVIHEILYFCDYATTIFFRISSPADQKLEQPLETAVLFTLSGVPCVLLNQWQRKASWNKKTLFAIFEGEYD